MFAANSMTRHDGEMQLSYELHSQLEQLGYFHKRIAGPTFRDDPKHFQRHIIGKLENMGSGRDIDGKYLEVDQAMSELNAVGRWLYQQLFTGQMAAEYRRFREHVRTLHIVSDEPWIPWEVVKPYDDSDPANVIDDDFLACQFAVARWMRSERPPLGQIHVHRLACIEAGKAPRQSPLTYARTEREYLAGLACATSIDDASPSPADWRNVNNQLNSGNVKLWHFATHGDTDLNQPDESQVILDSTRRLGRDARATKQLRRAARPPLVGRRLAGLRVRPPLL